MKVPVKLSLLANVTKASLSHVFLSDAPDPRMDQDLEPEVVEDIMLGSFLTFSHKSSSPILAPFFTRSGDKQIVKNHIDVVVIIYPLFQMLHIILRECWHAAHLDTQFLRLRGKVISQILNLISHHKLPDILCHFLDAAFKLAEGKAVLTVGQLCVHQCYGVHFHFHSFLSPVWTHVATRKVESLHLKRRFQYHK
jgi:hypothetical protein